jgi:hypothetical protein
MGVLENEFLEEIKNKLCELNTKKIEWNGEKIDVKIKCDRKELNNIEKQLMGDLYSNPAYNFDSIIVTHTTQIITSKNKKSNYNIKFYISKLIGDKTICKNSYGVL